MEEDTGMIFRSFLCISQSVSLYLFYYNKIIYISAVQLSQAINPDIYSSLLYLLIFWIFL